MCILLQLICVPKNGNKIGPTFEMISKGTVETAPPFNAFETKQLFTTDRLPSNQFRVISYNLLADYYCDSDFSRKELFPYCPPYALAIDYRKLIFIREILGYHADICCLQEVDAKVFDLDLKVSLGKDLFDGVMQKKGATAEGIATFYRRDKFALHHSHGLNLNEHMESAPFFKQLYKRIKNNAKLCERMLALSTAIQVTVLKSTVNGHLLIVANTHLYFHPDADHIRVLQIGFFMLYVEHIYKSVLSELNGDDNRVSIIFCGDFNSVPECGIHKLMTEKYVPSDYIDFKSSKFYLIMIYYRGFTPPKIRRNFNFFSPQTQKKRLMVLI